MPTGGPVGLAFPQAGGRPPRGGQQAALPTRSQGCPPPLAPVPASWDSIQDPRGARPQLESTGCFCTRPGAREWLWAILLLLQNV